MQKTDMKRHSTFLYAALTVVAAAVLRHLWYLYYLPMLFIPLLAVFVAVSLGKLDGYDSSAEEEHTLAVTDREAAATDGTKE